MHTEGMLAAHREAARHRDGAGNINEALIRCIDECYSCAQTCTSCADACLAENGVDQLRQCIRLAVDCADVCRTTGSVANRQTGDNRETLIVLLDACATACRTCADECERHADKHEHCRICALSCRSCEDACRDEAMLSLGEQI